MLMRLLFAASICLLITCTAVAMPPSVNHTENYTVVLTYGQTPYQIGYRASGNVTAWNWWDTDEGMQQQNLILAMVLDKAAHPVGGLSQPSFSLSQTRFRTGLNTYSLKADNDGTGNYSNNMDIRHWVPLNLTGHTKSELTFYTWYRIVPGDYGYVKVSTDDGKTWTELANYTGDQTGTPVMETIDLSAYDGMDILLAFNFVSDSSGVDEGWYIDDIEVVADYITIPFFNWRLFGSTIFKDGATSTPSELVVEVSYPSYYSKRTETIKLQEYSKGLYGGIFYYAANETYSGRYDIKFTNSINGTDPASIVTTFDTTLWGCQASNCHDAWSPTNDPSNRTLTDIIHPDNITSSTATNCLTACHTPSASQFLRATPVHLHEIVYGHYGGFVCGDAGWIEIFNETNVNIRMYRDTSVKRPLVQGAFNQPSHASASAPVGCIDCHTKFVHDNAGSVSYQVAPPNILQGTNITYGVHSNVSCEECHGNLSYPKFTSGVRSLKGTLNGYVPEFMSYEESTGTYIIDVDGTSGISVTVVAEDTDHEFLLSLIGPVNNITTGLEDLNGSDPWRGTYLLPSVDGTAIFEAGGKICYPYGEHLNVVTFDSGSPKQGTWVVRILARTPESFNYTITSSNYSITRKPIIHIPWNCSECHQSSPPKGCEGAETGLTIPGWDNYGLAYTHTDIDGDGSDDVTCRACHNALHDVGILDCVNCHQTPPGGHASIFSNYLTTTYKDCLRCHNDPHYGPELAAGGDCADCHLSGGINATGGLPIIDKAGFNASVHRNITGDYDASNNTAIGMVCWGCHNNYTGQLEDPKHFRIKPNCTDCHVSETPLNIDYLPRPPRQAIEHQPNGTDAGTAVNCTKCHNKSLVQVPGVPPTVDVNNPNARNFVSHYGRSRTDIIVDNGAASNCAYCHLDGGNEFGSVFADSDNADITHGVDCAACHGYGRIHDDVFTVPVMAPGNNSFCFACHGDLNYAVNKTLLSSGTPMVNETWFNKGIHAGANCTDCHTPLPISAPGSIKEGEDIDHPFDIPEDVKEMNVTLDWAGSDLDITLIDPNGMEVNLSIAASDPDVDHVAGAAFEYYLLRNPINGSWIAKVTGIDVTGTESYTLAVDLLVEHPGAPPHGCEDCHVNPLVERVYGALQAVQHTNAATEVPVEPECMGCHNKSEMLLPHGYVTDSEVAEVSHYGKPRTGDIVIDDGAASNCSYCHCDGGHEFNGVFKNDSNANITHGIGFALNCTDCHGYGRIHDAAISSPTMVPGNNSLCMNTACHSNPLKSWFVDISAFNSGIHRGANCTDCHTPLQPIDDIHGTVSTGEPEPRCYSFEVPEKIDNATVKQINITLEWVSGSLNLTLNVYGVEINPSVAETDPKIKYTVNETFISYLITNPANGTWEACVSDASTTTGFNLHVEIIFGHPKHDDCYTNSCDSCHATSIAYNAPPIAEHVTYGTRIDAEVWTEASCTDCHRNDITHPSSVIDAPVNTSNEGSMTAHYGVLKVLDTRDCISCHENDDIGKEWGDAPDPREIVRYEYVENASDTSDTYRTGEVWRLKNGYEIVVGPVSSTGSSVWVDLAHNGVSIQRELVSEGGVFEYEIEKDWIKSKSNAGDPLYGTGHETYKHRQSDRSSYTTIIDLKVDNIFTSGMMGVVTFKGLIIKSRIHIETENKPCYTCHVDGYRYYAPKDGDSYVVLRNGGADGDHGDSDDITIGRLPINFTKHEHRIQHVQSGWDLGYGYLLQVTGIDLVGGNALVELSKDGIVLQREVVPEDGIFRYNTTITDKEGHTMKDVTVFEMRISGVFRG